MLPSGVRLALVQGLWIELCREHAPAVLQSLERPGRGDPLSPEEKEVKELKRYIQRNKAQGYTPDQWAPTLFRAAWELYQAELHALSKVDFADMVAAVLRMLRERPDVAEALRARWQFVLVDEFQDCNVPLVELALALQGDIGRLTVVGDDDQSIYRFLAAQPRMFEIYQQVGRPRAVAPAPHAGGQLHVHRVHPASCRPHAARQRGPRGQGAAPVGRDRRRAGGVGAGGAERV